MIDLIMHLIQKSLHVVQSRNFDDVETKLLKQNKSLKQWIERQEQQEQIWKILRCCQLLKTVLKPIFWGHFCKKMAFKPIKTKMVVKRLESECSVCSNDGNPGTKFSQGHRRRRCKLDRAPWPNLEKDFCKSYIWFFSFLCKRTKRGKGLSQHFWGWQ